MVDAPDGGRVNIPAARFVQWKAELTAAPDGVSPALDSVTVAYLRQNIAPKIDQIEATLPNYKFPAPAVPLTVSSPATLTLPGDRRTCACRAEPRRQHHTSDADDDLRQRLAGNPLVRLR